MLLTGTQDEPRRMTLEQIRIFVEAARYNSFTSAAHQLGMTQSAVSMSVRKLEEELKVSLFERVGRKVVASKAGQILLNEGERLLRDVELTVRRIESLQAHGARMLLACTRNAYDFWVPSILDNLDCFGIGGLDIICGLASEVSAWVMRGTADFGLSEMKPGHPEFRYHAAFEDELILCATPGWRARTSKTVEWRTLAEIAPIVWEQDTDLETVLMAELQNQGQSPAAIAKAGPRLTSTLAVLSLVQGGRCAGFVSLGAASQSLRAGHLVALGPSVSVPYWLFSVSSCELGPLAAQVCRAAAGMQRNLREARYNGFRLEAQ